MIKHGEPYGASFQPAENLFVEQPLSLENVMKEGAKTHRQTPYPGPAHRLFLQSLAAIAIGPRQIMWIQDVFYFRSSLQIIDYE